MPSKYLLAEGLSLTTRSGISNKNLVGQGRYELIAEAGDILSGPLDPFPEGRHHQQLAIRNRAGIFLRQPISGQAFGRTPFEN